MEDDLTNVLTSFYKELHLFAYLQDAIPVVTRTTSKGPYGNDDTV